MINPSGKSKSTVSKPPPTSPKERVAFAMAAVIMVTRAIKSRANVRKDRRKVIAASLKMEQEKLQKEQDVLAKEREDRVAATAVVAGCSADRTSEWDVNPTQGQGIYESMYCP
jgi:hypothetical protein